MRKILKIEFQRLFKNKTLYLALALNLLIVTMQTVSEVLPYIGDDMVIALYPLTVFEKWIGGERSSVYPMLYFMLAPLVSAIPYGGSLAEDIRSGYIKNICTRISKKDYLKAKYVVTFSTGLISVVPLVFNFLFTAMLLPALVPQVGTGFYPISETSMLAGLFYTHPFIYVAIWMLIDVLLFGLIATISLVVTLFSEYVYVATLAPFLFCMIMYGIGAASGYEKFVPVLLLHPAQIESVSPVALVIEIILLAVAGGIYYYGRKKEQIY